MALIGVSKNCKKMLKLATIFVEKFHERILLNRNSLNFEDCDNRGIMAFMKLLVRLVIKFLGDTVVY